MHSRRDRQSCPRQTTATPHSRLTKTRSESIIGWVGRSALAYGAPSLRGGITTHVIWSACENSTNRTLLAASAACTYPTPYIANIPLRLRNGDGNACFRPNRFPKTCAPESPVGIIFMRMSSSAQCATQPIKPTSLNPWDVILCGPFRHTTTPFRECCILGGVRLVRQ